MIRASGAAVAIALLAVLGVAGCSTPQQAPSSDDKPFTGSVPAFDGPYASDFARAFEHAGSESIRRTLSDGKITSAEFAEARAGTSACMKDNGYRIVWEGYGRFGVESKDGRYPDDFQKKMDPILQACEHESDGEITFLYQETQTNPRKEDQRADIVACLRRHGLVTRHYTLQDYIRDDATGAFPFDEFDQDGQACDTDPLGVEPEGL